VWYRKRDSVYSLLCLAVLEYHRTVHRLWEARSRNDAPEMRDKVGTRLSAQGRASETRVFFPRRVTGALSREGPIKVTFTFFVLDVSSYFIKNTAGLLSTKSRFSDTPTKASLTSFGMWHGMRRSFCVLFKTGCQPVLPAWVQATSHPTFLINQSLAVTTGTDIGPGARLPRVADARARQRCLSLQPPLTTSSFEDTNQRPRESCKTCSP
jgi:hypothetical protein